MGSFGRSLKEAREARGLSLDEVAETTRIARHHLAALEEGDLDALPAGPFAKGYIEAYGKAVGIDPGPAVEAWREEAHRRGAGTAEAEGRMLDELAQIVQQRSGGTDDPQRFAGWKAIVIAAAVVAVLAVGGWLALRGRPPEPEAMEPPPATAPPSAPSPSSPAAASETPPPTDGRGGESTPSARPAATPDRGAAAPSRAEPAPTPEAPRPNPDLAVSDSGVGTAVVNHQLVGAAEEFNEGIEVVFWTRVVGGRPGDVVHHVWLHEGRGVARVPLRIGSASWRTYSRRPLPRGAAGRWTVEARGADGRVLARQEFVCAAVER